MMRALDIFSLLLVAGIVVFISLGVARFNHATAAMFHVASQEASR